MRVIRDGAAKTEFRVRAKCVGSGLRRRGCSAELELAEPDLRYSESPLFTAAVLFKCPQCGAVSCIGKESWPTNPTHLKIATLGWKYAPVES